MALPFLSELICSTPPQRLIDVLSHTPFDELLSADLSTNTVIDRFHMDRKFFMPVINGSLSRLIEYTESNLIHPEDRETYRALFDPASLPVRLEQSEPPGILTGEFRLLALNGEWYTMFHLLVSGPRFGLERDQFYLYLYDIQEIEYRAHGHQQNVQLSSGLLDRMPDMLQESTFFALVERRMESLDSHWSLIAVDVQHFKLFKELNGQEKGDQLLVTFASILHRYADAMGGLACYRGQDDFGLFIPSDRNVVEQLFSDLRKAIDALSATSGFVPILGICMIDNPNESPLNLFNQAALTAEEIKDDPRTHIRIYEPGVHERHVEEFRLLAEFRNALAGGEIQFYLQPQCKSETGQIIGAESLARWIRPDGTMISPAVFVPVLEKYGLVTDLDLYIWEAVCKWLRQVIDRGLTPVPISVNISRVDLFSIPVSEKLIALAQKYSLPSRLIKAEITESAYAEDAAQVSDTVSGLQRLGFQVLMDDFGSGYSSLNMLRTMNMDVIKLDAQFLRFNAEDEKRGINILESVINMTQALSTPIIVEGVESRELARFLEDMGCRYMQGFFYYRPMPVSQFERLISDPGKVDPAGLQPSVHVQLHNREFLDESIYSDAMLNNILGPVAFYRLKDDSVDIVRYNEQFFRMVGLTSTEIEYRRFGIQKYFHPDDRARLFRMLRTAINDRMNGAEEVFRVNKPSGLFVWIQVHAWFLKEEGNCQLFYTSARDVTELQYLNAELPGGYFRCTADRKLEFIYISSGFLSMLGFTKEEIRQEFGNRLINLVHPEDVEPILERSRSISSGKERGFQPFRIRHRDGNFRYVTNQAILTDRFGALCWQCVLSDITPLMTLRNRMHLLELYSTDCIVFLKDPDLQTAEVAIYGLQETLMRDQASFIREMKAREIPVLNSHGENLFRLLKERFMDPASLNGMYTLHMRDGRKIAMHMRFYHIDDPTQEVRCIVSMSPAVNPDQNSI